MYSPSPLTADDLTTGHCHRVVVPTPATSLPTTRFCSAERSGHPCLGPGLIPGPGPGGILCRPMPHGHFLPPRNPGSHDGPIQSPDHSPSVPYHLLRALQSPPFVNHPHEVTSPRTSSVRRGHRSSVHSLQPRRTGTSQLPRPRYMTGQRSHRSLVPQTGYGPGRPSLRR